MRILIFSDIHLHNWAYGSSVVNGMNSRLLDQANIFRQINTYCLEVAGTRDRINHIVFGGDLFHTQGKIASDVLKIAYEGFKLLTQCANITCLVGNHDTDRKDKSVHSLHWLESLGNIAIVDDLFHGMAWSFLSYTEDREHLKAFLNKAEPLVFMHQGVSGVPVGSGFLINEILTEDIIPDHVDQVFTGHYHTHSTRGKIAVIGSALQLNWSDKGDTKGFLVYDTATGIFEQIETDAPKFVEYHNDPEPDIFRDSVDNCFVRAYGHVLSEQDAAREFLLGQGARSVEFVLPKMDAAKLSKLDNKEFHLPTVVKEYEESNDVSKERHDVGQELMK